MSEPKVGDFVQILPEFRGMYPHAWTCVWRVVRASRATFRSPDTDFLHMTCCCGRRDVDKDHFVGDPIYSHKVSVLVDADAEVL